jgi:pyruvate formate lyase activating enzyme
MLNEGQVILLTWGRIAAEGLEPIEKKPLRQFQPGTQVYTFASPGCTLTCRFCQNWELTCQIDRLDLSALPIRSPQQMVDIACSAGAQGLACSFTEPGVFLEFALQAMQVAHQTGLYTVWHTNGHFSPQAAKQATRHLDAACIDLKGSNQPIYRNLTGGDLAPVLACIKTFREAGVWVEISTPLLPGWNNHPDQIRQMAKLIIEASGPQTPWHLLRGHAAWQMNDLRMPAYSEMEDAAQIAHQAGLESIYLGV